jgi:hypothetical protein
VWEGLLNSEICRGLRGAWTGAREGGREEGKGVFFSPKHWKSAWAWCVWERKMEMPGRGKSFLIQKHWESAVTWWVCKIQMEGQREQRQGRRGVVYGT